MRKNKQAIVRKMQFAAKQNWFYAAFAEAAGL